MTTRATIQTKTGSVGSGELAEPSGSGKAPSVVLIHEWWGVNDHIRDLADRLSRDGFLVVAPDLYHGKVAKDSAEAGKLMTELDTMAAVKDIDSAIGFLKEHPRSNGKIGVIGFCMGGALSLASACHIEGLSAVAAFYGVPAAEKVDYAKVTAPVLAHFAKRDEWATVAKAEEIKKQLDKRGHAMELHVYDAEHAFVNDTRPEVHNKECAKLAWDRTVAFFRKHLA